MKTNVTDTSIQAYKELKEEGGLNKQYGKILDVMSRGRDYSLQELVKLTGLQINVISARVFEMKEKRTLVVAQKRRCSISKRLINALKLPSRQEELFC